MLQNFSVKPDLGLVRSIVILLLEETDHYIRLIEPCKLVDSYAGLLSGTLIAHSVELKDAGELLPQLREELEAGDPVCYGDFQVAVFDAVHRADLAVCSGDALPVVEHSERYGDDLFRFGVVDDHLLLLRFLGAEGIFDRRPGISYGLRDGLGLVDMAEGSIVEAGENVFGYGRRLANLGRAVGVRELRRGYEGVGGYDIDPRRIHCLPDAVAEDLCRSLLGGDLALPVGEEGDDLVPVEEGDGVDVRVSDGDRLYVSFDFSGNIESGRLQQLPAGSEAGAAVVVAGDDYHLFAELLADLRDGAAV